MVRMADTRNCEQCGAQFSPRREHGRFCSARCRVAWNRSHVQGPASDSSALEWSITAMIDTTDRLPRIRGLDRPRAFAIIGEAVWWVTIVDGTLVRYHPDAYDRVLSERPPSDRAVIEETLAGLRFVRNRMGHDVDHVDFIHLRPGRADRINRVTDWRWSHVPEQTFDWLSPRGQEWEAERYRAYQHRLAGHTIGDTFTRAGSFLKIAAAQATAVAVQAAGPAGR
jgi:hypothetical protein